ncbi:MAG: hypothetical protein KIS94_05635 [Chitinophagales bacterium]|nr:hypothetical protein [Chitinophagales bacterium]
MRRNKYFVEITAIVSNRLHIKQEMNIVSLVAFVELNVTGEENKMFFFKNVIEAAKHDVWLSTDRKAEKETMSIKNIWLLDSAPLQAAKEAPESIN